MKASLEEVATGIGGALPQRQDSSHVVFWFAEGGLAILGQALFAGANFGINILLARWLSPADYGVFVLVYSFFLFAAAFYGASVYEPLIVFGSGKYSAQYDEYLSVLLRGNALLLILFAILLAIVAIVIGRIYSHGAESAFFGLVVAGPLILVTWLGRGASYARRKQIPVVIAGAVYLLVSVACVAVLNYEQILTPAKAFGGMGIAGALGGVVLFIRQDHRKGDAQLRLRLRQVTRDHWDYGKWAIGVAIASWIPYNIFYVALPYSVGMKGAAALRALINFIYPVDHSLIALAAVMIPVLVKRYQHAGVRNMARTIKFFLWILISSAVLYSIVLAAFGGNLFQLLYKGKYREFSGVPLLLLSLVPAVQVVVVVLGAGLRALERPDVIFKCGLVSSAIALFIGIPLTVYEGVTGAAAGILISWLGTAVALVAYYRARISSHVPASGEA